MSIGGIVVVVILALLACGIGFAIVGRLLWRSRRPYLFGFMSAGIGLIIMGTPIVTNLYARNFDLATAIFWVGLIMFVPGLAVALWTHWSRSAE